MTGYCKHCGWAQVNALHRLTRQEARDSSEIVAVVSENALSDDDLAELLTFE